ncbi:MULTISPECIES: conjugal transfer nickase/helicase domain-containing protein [Buttiauxella]|uniref:conjugal transfer nickase/helicase domain-containing protein n=1 Tax=Buttiauxella TaxID=82976 RepID=UPI002444C65D|nr:DNA-binding domain-containing protein [Buttiauxella sp. BIGb0552]
MIDAQLHRKHPSGLNIWMCDVTGPRKSRQLHGYLLQDPLVIFTELPLRSYAASHPRHAKQMTV